MKYGRIYNFSAGPAIMPEPVLEEIADEVMNYHGSGMSVMEMSHRSAVFQRIRDDAENDLRKLMNIPDNYRVLFIQVGGCAVGVASNEAERRGIDEWKRERLIRAGANYIIPDYRDIKALERTLFGND